MARDRRFIAPKLLSHVSRQHVPTYPLFLFTIISITFVFVSDSITALSGAATVCASIYYLVTVLGFAFKVKNLPPTNTFFLGRWHWPVVIVAATWLVIEIGILTIPSEFHPVATATAGVLVVGLVLYFLSGRVPQAKA
jgi:amino acid transporter